MKKKVWRAVKIVLFFTVLLICFLKTASLLERKTSIIKYTPFFEQKADYDVLFMGSSHVVNGIFPMELWEDYGIVSYNFGGHGNQMGVNYWVMKNALDYTTPKLMVIDVFGTHYQEKRSSNAEQMHEAFDAFPVSLNKYRMMQDLFDDGSEEEYGSRWEYVFPFGKYHSRWELLNKEDFHPVMNREKGAEARIDVAVPIEFPVCSAADVMEDEDTVGMDYLCRMIEECQKRNIPVLLIHLPYPAVEDYQRAANSVYRIAEEYGVNYINFINDNVINYDIDCYDEGSHLNPSGARKVTDFLGNYMVINYGIPDRRQDKTYQQWHADYQEYSVYMREKLNGLEDLDDYLMMLRDENLNVSAYISAQSGYLQDVKYHMLLDNLRDGDILSEIAEATLNERDYLLTVDHEKGETLEFQSSAEQTPFRDFLGGENGQVLVKVEVYDRGTGELVSSYIQKK